MRIDRLTKRLARRLSPGEIAVVDHPDLDRLSAAELVARGAVCVINVACSSSGRYPNEGPAILVDAGVHLVDVDTPRLFEVLADGDRVTVRGGKVVHEGRVVAEGRVLDRRALAEGLAAARGRIGEAIEAFAANTVAHLREEGDLLSMPLELPELKTRLRDRPALVLSRGAGHDGDLRALLPFVRRENPVLLGVDGAADAFLAVGLEPDVIVGDMDSASDRALAGGAELLVHAYRDGRAPGRTRLDALGLPHRAVSVPGTSEDAALLLAAEKGARPIVSVGSRFDLVEFLDRARSGMASTFLTRLRLGENLIDARGLGLLHGGAPSARP